MYMLSCKRFVGGQIYQMLHGYQNLYLILLIMRQSLIATRQSLTVGNRRGANEHATITHRKGVEGRVEIR